MTPLGPPKTGCQAAMGKVFTTEIKLRTQRTSETVDLTDELRQAVAKAGITDGIVVAFCPGSTGAITTVEYEPGLLQDLPELLEAIIPSNRSYHHDQTWHDGNGFSHLRAALIGPDITVPVVAGTLVLGTWQQVVFIECDNRGRQRRLLVQVMGE